MPDNVKKTRQVETEAERKKHLDELLDQALLETFPASDPPAISIEDIPIPRKKPNRKQHR
jgi:hypothetical protein